MHGLTGRAACRRANAWRCMARAGGLSLCFWPERWRHVNLRRRVEEKLTHAKGLGAKAGCDAREG